MTEDTIKVSFLCNDEKTGTFKGFAESIHFGENHLVYVGNRKGIHMRFLSPFLIEIGNKIYQHFGHIPGYGNWCFDCFILDKKDLAKLLNYIKKNFKKEFWDFYEGEDSICKKWELDKTFVKGDFE